MALSILLVKNEREEKMGQTIKHSEEIEVVEFSEIMRFDSQIIFGVVLKNNVLGIFTSYAGTSDPFTRLYGLGCEEVKAQVESKVRYGDDSYVWEYVPRNITFSEEKLFDGWDIGSWWIGTDYAPFGNRSYDADYAKRGAIKLASYIPFLEA
jgi:hypothetical protein